MHFTHIVHSCTLFASLSLALQLMVYSETAIIIAAISIVLYLVLIGLCVHHARKFWEVLKGRQEGGLYAHAKFVFFVVLGLSALLELPTFIGCTINPIKGAIIQNHDNS